MLTLYAWLLRALVPVVLLRLLLRGARNRGYWRRWGERFGFVPRLDHPRVLWVHAVSVGETRAAAPLIRALQQAHPGCAMLVTTMTPTGSAQVRQLFGDTVHHCYLPYDLPGAVRRFFDRARPVAGIIMETELWPTLFHAAKARGIPLAVANLRLSETSMRKYLRFPRLTRRTLAQVNLFAVQAQDDAARLAQLGADARAIHVTGSIKFDIDLPPDLTENAARVRAEWGTARPVWIAASTHEGEEEQVLEAHRALRREVQDALLVLVPRHPERFGAVARLCRKAGFETVQRSADRGAIAANVDVVLADTMGELQMLIAASDVAFIGGSLVPTGGHNLLEAAAVGVPVLFGPHMFNFADISRMALNARAGRQVADAQALAAVVGELLQNQSLRDEVGKAGRAMVAQNRGALARTLALLEGIIPA